MLIILEGADGAGKTTLAEGLAAELNREGGKVEVVHRGKPTLHPLEEYLTPLCNYRPGAGHHLILDRWHWGERVYPKVLDRETKFDDAMFWYVEAYLRRLGALVVHCDRATTMEYRDVYRRRQLDASSQWQITHLEPILLEFQRMIYRSMLPSMTYFVGDGILSAIISSARHYEAHTHWLNDFTTYLGLPKPHTLLVGDVRHKHDPKTTTSPLPAFVPFGGTSGHFLTKSLTSLTSRFWLHGVGVANACDVDDITHLYDVLKLHDRPKIVALGKNAYAKLTTAGFKCSVVPHPQFVRRFHHSKHVEYGWLLYNAAQEVGDYSKWPQSSTRKQDETPTPTSSASSGSSEFLGPVVTVRPAT